MEKVRELRAEHNRDAQQEIIEDLKTLKELLVEDIKNLPEQGGTAEHGTPTKAEYRILHLKRSFLALLEQSEREKAELWKENQKLNYRINIMKDNLKSE